MSVVFLVPLVVLIAIVIALFNRKGRKFLAFFGIAILVVSIAAWVLFMVFASPVSRPVAEKAISATRPADRDPAGRSAPIWSDGIEDEFQADVYPSKASAVRALARRLGEEMEGLVEADARLVVFGDDDGLANEVRRALQHRWNVTKDKDRHLKEGQVGIDIKVIDIETLAAPWDPHDEAIHASLGVPCPTVSKGRVEIKLDVPGGLESIISGAEFIEKPWIENFAEFASRYPGREFHIARSRESAVSFEQASREAMIKATSIVWGRLRNIQSQQEVRGSSGLTFDLNEVAEFGFVVDKFSQSLKGIVSPIYRQAILIEITPDRLKRLADRKFRIVQVRRRTWAGMVASLIGVMALICGVYFFLDFATRGYYTWALRILAILIAAAGVVVVLFLT